MLLPGKICRHANRDVIYMFHINIAIIHLLTNPVAFILKYQIMNIKKNIILSISLNFFLISAFIPVK